MMMGGGGLIATIIWAILVIVPFYHLLPRYGMNKYLSVLAVIPVITLIFLWIMAFSARGRE